MAPAKPGEMNNNNLTAAMKDEGPFDFIAIRNNAKRFKFNNRFWWPGESVSSYVAELRASSSFVTLGTH